MSNAGRLPDFLPNLPFDPTALIPGGTPTPGPTGPGGPTGPASPGPQPQVGDHMSTDPAHPQAPSSPPNQGSPTLNQPGNSPTVSMRGGAAQSGGAATVQSLRTSLANMGPMKEQVYTLLNDPNFVRFVLDHPEVLDRAANMEPAALQELAQHMPAGSPLRTQLETGAAALGSPLGGLATLGASALGIDIAGLQSQMRSIAGGVRQLNANPTARAAVDAALAAGVRPGEVLRAIENGSIDPAVLGRVMDGRPEAGDIPVLLRGLRDATPNHTLTLNPSDPATRALMERLHIPAGAFTSVTFGPDDKLHVHTGNEAAMRAANLPASLAGQDLTIDMSQLNGNGLRLSTQIGFGPALKALFTESLTGNGALDVFLRILMALLIPLTLLYVGLSSRRVDVDMHDGRADVSVNHLFGRTNLTSFRTPGLGAAPDAPGSPSGTPTGTPSGTPTPTPTPTP